MDKWTNGQMEVPAVGWPRCNGRLQGINYRWRTKFLTNDCNSRLATKDPVQVTMIIYIIIYYITLRDRLLVEPFVLCLTYLRTYLPTYYLRYLPIRRGFGANNHDWLVDLTNPMKSPHEFPERGYQSHEFWGAVSSVPSRSHPGCNLR